LGSARVRDLGAATINIKTSTAGPWEVLELKIREHPPSTLKISMAGPLAPAGGPVPIRDPRGVL
jgi:hypothetical protein